jgi:hypothetical protein
MYGLREVEPLPYTWVSTTGGPLLAAPQSALSLWTGADSRWSRDQLGGLRQGVRD